MAKDTKFGLFGGVFTPSILTILGVIMYLRLPWVVGQSGLWGALGIILVAHVVSISTGLSISSIATDKKVGAGGPYYIVSRSLGLPIGGTLGLALFLGLSFSISLYIIGFSESFLGTVGIEATPTAIRVCGTIVLIVLSVISFISTAFAIKTQYLIMVLIGLSLLSIFLGSPEPVAAHVHTTPLDDAPSMATMFGIFFPAVTGFTAGVNMSGDLRDPKGAIPVGTLLAIGTGFAVYVGLAIFLAVRVPPDQLADYDVLLNISLFPPAVVAGVWGATLSSALGSILGAPRILQATASDRITPSVFAKGYGKANEPRNALLLACAIGWAGILIAELDAIAAIVSMVFLTTYGFLNLSCAIESWVSPDFRPSFKIPTLVSVVGAVVCVLLMIQLDMLAMFGATLVMGSLFAFLQRRQLRLESGDAWQGIWSSLVRMGLYRLQGAEQQRNWRPNILTFARPDDPHRSKIRDLGYALVSGNGLVTHFDVVRDSGTVDTALANESQPGAGREIGIFERTIVAEDLFAEVGTVVEHHGFSGLEPNTVLLADSATAEDRNGFRDLLQRVARVDFNFLLYAGGRGRANGNPQRIDIWWRRGAGNLPLCVSLARMLTNASNQRRTQIRFLLVADEGVSADYLRAETRRLLDDRRLVAVVKVVRDAQGDGDFESLVRTESEDAELVVLGLPAPSGASRGGIPRVSQPDLVKEETVVDGLDELERIVPHLHGALLFRASSMFAPILNVGRRVTEIEQTPVDGGVDEEEDDALQLPSLHPPAAEALRVAAIAFAEHGDGVAIDLFEQGLRPLYQRNSALLYSISSLFLRHFGVLSKRLGKANPNQRGNVVNRVQSAFLLDAEKILEEFASSDLHDQRGRLEGRIDAFRTQQVFSPRLTLEVRRDKQDFAPAPGDGPYLRRLKRWHRIKGWLTRSHGYRVRIDALVRHYRARAKEEVLAASLNRFATDSHAFAVQVGKLLNHSKTSLALLGEEHETIEHQQSFIDEQETAAQAEIQRLEQDQSQRMERARRALLMANRELAQAYAHDLERIDLMRFQRLECRPSTSEHRNQEYLDDLPEEFTTIQSLLVERAKLGLTVSTFQHRLATIVHRLRERLAVGLRAGIVSNLRAIHAALELDQVLEHVAEAKEGADLKLNPEPDARFDPKPILDRVIRETGTLTAGLPTTTTTLSDDSIRDLTIGRCEEVESREVSARGVAQLLLETEFIGKLQSDLESIPPIEERAIGIARDVVRLLSFNVAEAADLPPEARAEQLAPVVASARERIAAELATVDAVIPRIDAAVRGHLEEVVTGTDAYELTRSSDNLTKQFRQVEGKKAISGLRGRLDRAVAAFRSGLVYVLYRRSAGVVYARRLEAAAALRGPTVDRLTAFVGQTRPRADVLKKLPFFYRQMFLGQSSITRSFWVERTVEIRNAREAISRHRAGAHGAVFVTGDRLSGKTALLHRIVQQNSPGQGAFWVHPPSGGSTSTELFAEALFSATRREGSIDDALAGLPERSVVVLDDFELWWERQEAGFAVIDVILDLVERHGDRILFIIGVSTTAFALIARLRPLSDKAVAVLRCGAMGAELLKEVVELRHGTAGMAFLLNNRPEQELSQWAMARLYSKYFDYSGGSVGAALRAWIASIREVRDKSIVIEAPEPKHWEVLDELRVEWKALLLELTLHKQMSRERLERVTGLTSATIAADVAALVRTGLVVEDREGILEIDPFVHHPLAERFHRGGLIP